MTAHSWPHMGIVLKMHALHYPDKLGWQDKNNEYSFREWNDRSCRVANGLRDMGVGYGGTFAVMAHNRGEWMDIYAGCAKGGQIVVPIMFRLAPREIEYIVTHSECKGFIVEAPFVDTINSVRDKLPIPEGGYIYLGKDPVPAGYRGYDEWLEGSSPGEQDFDVNARDTWTIMYTSGTTGKPKGVVRTHDSYMAQYYLSNVNFGVLPTDKVMMVMPMCHINSIFYSFCYTLVTAPVFIYNMVSFDPRDLLETIERYRVTFTSLVPTHYIMILNLPDEIKKGTDVSFVRQLMISSAPARKDCKLAIMDYFKNAQLFEAYGSTEGGLVTLLRPEDQFSKLGSIGREIFGTDRIRILDENRNEVPEGDVGELFYRTPMIFNEYFKDPERSREAFEGEWSSAGDMAKRDEDGYYILVDRKANMIITGGENVYPSEVEGVMIAHESIKDLAVIGVSDHKWGEAVKAVVVLSEGYEPGDELAEDIMDFMRGKLAGYKQPKSIDFIEKEDMPRTITGKIKHRILRERYGRWSDEEG